MAGVRAEHRRPARRRLSARARPSSCATCSGAGRSPATTEEESFFVRCDDELNPPASQALGRLVAEIGVAPAGRWSTSIAAGHPGRRRQRHRSSEPPMAENAELLQTFRFAVHLDRGSDHGATGSDPRRRRLLRVHRAGAGGRRPGVPRGRPQRRRGPPGRPGQAGRRSCSSAACSSRRRPAAQPTPRCGTGSPAWSAACCRSRATTAWSRSWTRHGQRVVATLDLRPRAAVKVAGPALNAKTGEIAIEELHIVHEGLRLEEPAPGATT